MHAATSNGMHGSGMRSAPALGYLPLVELGARRRASAGQVHEQVERMIEAMPDCGEVAGAVPVVHRAPYMGGEMYCDSCLPVDRCQELFNRWAGWTPFGPVRAYMAGAGGARLGALELIELGRARMGQFDPFGFLFGLLGSGIKGITDILKMPLDLVGEGTSFLIGGLADLATNIPLIGGVIAMVLRAAEAIILFAAVELPKAILTAIGNLGEAFKKLSPAQQQSATAAAEKQIIGAAPPGQQSQIKDILAKTPATTGAGAEGEFPVVPVLVGGGIAAAAVAAAVLAT